MIFGSRYVTAVSVLTAWTSYWFSLDYDMENEADGFKGTVRGKTYQELKERTAKYQILASTIMGYMLIGFGLCIAFGWLTHLSLYPEISLRLLLLAMNLIIILMGVGFILIAKRITPMFWVILGPTKAQWTKMSAKYP